MHLRPYGEETGWRGYLLRSGGSILLVVVWHATYDMISGTDAATGLLAATSTTLVIIAAFCLILLEIRGRRLGRPSTLGRVRSTV